MIDTAYFSYGVGIPMIGYICGFIFKLVLTALSMGREL